MKLKYGKGKKMQELNTPKLFQEWIKSLPPDEVVATLEPIGFKVTPPWHYCCPIAMYAKTLGYESPRVGWLNISNITKPFNNPKWLVGFIGDLDDFLEGKFRPFKVTASLILSILEKTTSEMERKNDD